MSSGEKSGVEPPHSKGAARSTSLEQAGAPRPQVEGVAKSNHDAARKKMDGMEWVDDLAHAWARGSGADACSGAGSKREIPAAVANAMSVAHCAERKEQGEGNMAVKNVGGD